MDGQRVGMILEFLFFSCAFVFCCLTFKKMMAVVCFFVFFFIFFVSSPFN